ncbi:uncharacterized protein LOC126767300 [Bactrocera neohumeralis]|uniref:uncharacterized protein LOC126767300 n=1 Tax=Bactrocera neohumeralis TaxID=98809 RepID=UPI002165BBDA|nr:uncharacterized protein LOC126767300 [Bactrocera neohumeralis]
MDASEDCCVEFYHDVGQLYPVCSTDAQMVQPLHREAGWRSREEKEWFACPATKDAVSRALSDNDYCSSLPPPEEGCAGSLSRSEAPSSAESLSFSWDELQSIRQLMGAVSKTTAAQLLESFSSTGQDLSARSVQQQRAKDQLLRKRNRVRTVGDARPARPSASPSENGPVAQAASSPPRTRHRPVREYRATAHSRALSKDDAAHDDDEDSWMAATVQGSSDRASGGRGKQGERTVAEECEGPVSSKLVQAADPEILEVIRAEVF